MMPGLPQPSPGLPQRPAFGAPNLSKEEMAKMHAGAMQASPNGAPPYSAPPHQQMPMKREEIGDSVDELISSVTGQKPLYSAAHSRPLPFGSDLTDFQSDSRHKQLPLHHRQEVNSQHNSPLDTGRVRTQPTDNTREGQVPNGRDHASPATPAPVSATPVSATPAPVSATPAQVSATPVLQPEESTPQSGTAVEKRKKKSKHNDEAVKLVYRDKLRSPEEKLAHKAKYAFHRNAHEHTQTVLGDISGALTGPTGDTVNDPADRSV